MDVGVIVGFLIGLRVYFDDFVKVKRLFFFIKFFGVIDGKKVIKFDELFFSLMNLLMGVKVLQQVIIDLFLDIMVECCQFLEESFNEDVNDGSLKVFMEDSGVIFFL